MAQHKDENCRVPFCKECLGKIHGVLNTARELTNPPKEKDTPKEAANELEELKHTKTTDKILAIIDSPTEDRNRYAVALHLTKWVESLIESEKVKARIEEIEHLAEWCPKSDSDQNFVPAFIDIGRDEIEARIKELKERNK